MVRIDFTLRKLPATGPLKDACGVPQSCAVQPVAPPSDGKPLTAPAGPSQLSALARCRHCYAYINHLCGLSDSAFTCAVCGKATELQRLTPWHNQYCRFPSARQHLPELQQQCYEVVVDPELTADGLGLHAQQQQQTMQQQHEQAAAGAGAPVVPVTLLLLDVAGPGEWLELLRSGLAVLGEALHPAGLVGIIGVSNRISLVDLRPGPAGPSVVHLPVLESAPVMVPLESVVPLHCLLAPAAEAKQYLSQALDLLVPSPSASSAAAATGSRGPVNLQQPGMESRTGAGADGGAAGAAGAAGSRAAAGGGAGAGGAGAGGHGGLTPPCRAVGPALQAVLEYLRGLHNPLTNPDAAGDSGNAGAAAGSGGTQLSGVAEVMLFLSGPPDISWGKTVAFTAAGGGGGAGSARAPAGDGTISPDSADITGQMSDLQLQYPVQDPSSKAFYEQAAVVAASMGVVVDVFAAARGYVGLQTLEPLVNSTGGLLQLYPSMEEATLAQDLHRRLTTPKALAGMLRLRASSQVRVSRSYGRLYADQQYSDLFHVPCCDAGQGFVFDLEHTGNGSSDERVRHVTLQVAFQYSQMVPLAAASKAASERNLAALASSGRQFVLQRRLRVCTVRLPIAFGPAEVYASVDADTVLTSLTHKITKAVRAQSVSEARLLLRDWLVIFTANYHRNSFMRASAAQLLQLPVDLAFTSCPPLQPLPRLVYALLRSPLLSSAAQYHSDLTAYLHYLWCGLPPAELSRAVYPRLAAFADPDTLIADCLPLSRHSLQGAQLAEAAAAAARKEAAVAQAAAQQAAALQQPAAATAVDVAALAAGGAAAANGQAAGPAAGVDAALERSASAAAAAQYALSLAAAVAEGRQGANILLLDAFILVLVLYRSGAPPDAAFPPPQQSRLWRLIQDIKRTRRVTAHVEVAREGSDAAELFHSLLIDDPDDVADSPLPPLPGEEQQQQQQQPAVPAASGTSPAAAAGGSGPSPTGVDQFLEHVKAEVFMQLQPQQR